MKTITNTMKRMKYISDIYRMVKLMADGTTGIWLPYALSNSVSFDFIEICYQDFILIKWKEQEIEFQFDSDNLTIKDLEELHGLIEEVFQNWLTVK